MKRRPIQLELFRDKARIRNKFVSNPCTPRTAEEAAVAKRLEAAMRGDDSTVIGPGISRTAARRLMVPLPRVTAPGWQGHPWSRRGR